MTGNPGWTILVVDDDEGLRNLIVRSLAKQGYEARGLGSGAEAVREVPSCRAPLLLLDQKLPDMGGSEVIGALRSGGTAVPFVMMTGQGNERLAVEMMKLGASDYLVKDVDLLDRLPGVLDRVLRALETERRLQSAEQALREKADELAVLNLGLEQKVADRTSELVAKNRELTEALGRLEAAQEQLVEADRLRTVAQLVAGIAHELNTPLGVALTAATALLGDQKKLIDSAGSGTLDPPVLQETLSGCSELGDLLVRSIDRSIGLVEDFKQLAVAPYDEVRSFSLLEHGELVFAALRNQWADRPLSLDVDIAPDLVVQGHASDYTQILTNLVENSLKHGFGAEGPGRMSFSARRRDGVLELVYRDTGRGMDPHTRDHSFDPFFTTNRQAGHLGLGLPIVMNLVRNRLGGTLELETAPGQGVSVTVRVPWSRVAAPPSLLPSA